MSMNATTLHLTRTSRRDSAGAIKLLLERFTKDGKRLDAMDVCSGQPWAQHFRPAALSQAGSWEPIPEGYYAIDPALHWAGGKHNYEAYWNAGLGPVVADIIPLVDTERSELRVHLDANRTTAPGSAGCICQYTMVDLRRYVGWHEDAHGAPDRLVVDYGLGTVTRAFGAAPAEVEEKAAARWAKVFDHDGKRTLILPGGTQYALTGIKIATAADIPAGKPVPFPGGSILLGIKVE